MSEAASEEILATYNLCLIGSRNALGGMQGYWHPIVPDEQLRETEENLTDLLPPGYRVEIKEWNSE